MGLGRFKKILFFLTALSIGLIFSLGIWWPYLILKLNKRVQELSLTVTNSSLTKDLLNQDLLNMIIWEGAAFIILIFFVQLILIVMYFRDKKREKAIHDFFISLTYDLKRPLSSLKLQTDMLNDFILDKNIPIPRLKEVNERLNKDLFELEMELDNILQLSKIERGEKLHLTTVDLAEFLFFLKSFYPHIEVDIQNNDNSKKTILGEQRVLTFIFKYILSNIEKKISLTLSKNKDLICVTCYPVNHKMEFTLMAKLLRSMNRKNFCKYKKDGPLSLFFKVG